MQLYFINHTRKQLAYIGEGESDHITFVFTQFGWKITDLIIMTCDVDDYEQVYETLE